MKTIYSIFVLLVVVLFSCQNKNGSTSNSDSLSIDSTQNAMSLDTAANLATEEEIIRAESDTDDPQVMTNEDYDFTYEGLLNNTIKVKVNIFQYRGEQMARMVYVSAGKIINMDAEYPAVGTFVLTEKIDGKPTGIWNISADAGDALSGTRSSPDGTKKMPVKLNTMTEDFDAFLGKDNVKTGFYEMKEVNDEPETKEQYPTLNLEQLFVKNMEGNTIYFDLYIQGPPPGVHVGSLTGMANKIGNSYFYKNEEGCELTMIFTGNTVSLNQKESEMKCGFGAGIAAYEILKKK